MNLAGVYEKRVAENDKNVHFWEDYLKNLNSLDFNVYKKKLKVPALVPIGSRVLFRGEIIHTNEVIVALGADYFAKCSLQQAEILRQHRIKDAQSKLKSFRKERQYLQNQLSFNKENIFAEFGKEIVEKFSEEDEKAWRKQHRENVKKYIQNRHKQKESEADIDDEELWNRLEELELEEELENELQSSSHNTESSLNGKDEYTSKEEDTIFKGNLESLDKSNDLEKVFNTDPKETIKSPPKQDLIQQVIEKQNELQNKLEELKLRDTYVSKTENDLISKLDELELLDELEDEIDRLDDVLLNEDAVELEETHMIKASKVNKKISFADEDDSQTLELNFKHTDNEPEKTSYVSGKGITKPSDIYEAFSNLFEHETTSILKKTKYQSDTILDVKNIKKQVPLHNKTEIRETDTIEIKDVVEKTNPNVNKNISEGRPMSLFKKRKLHKPSK